MRTTHTGKNNKEDTLFIFCLPTELRVLVTRCFWLDVQLIDTSVIPFVPLPVLSFNDVIQFNVKRCKLKESVLTFSRWTAPH